MSGRVARAFVLIHRTRVGYDHDDDHPCAVYLSEERVRDAVRRGDQHVKWVSELERNSRASGAWFRSVDHPDPWGNQFFDSADSYHYVEVPIEDHPGTSSPGHVDASRNPIDVLVDLLPLEVHLDPKSVAELRGFLADAAGDVERRPLGSPSEEADPEPREWALGDLCEFEDYEGATASGRIVLLRPPAESWARIQMRDGDVANRPLSDLRRPGGQS